MDHTLSTIRFRKKAGRRDFSWLILLLAILLLAFPSLAEQFNKQADKETALAFEGQSISKDAADEWTKAIDEYNKSLSSSKFFSEYDPFAIQGEVPSTTPQPGASKDTTVTAGNPQAAVPQAAAPSVYSFFQTGSILFTIHIPKLDLIIPVFYGSDSASLLKGGGLVKNTSYPGSLGGNALISAHRGTHDKELFLNIHKLLPGDVFYIVDQTQKMKYVVTGQAVVSPYDTSMIHLLADKDLVTLVTCTPIGLNYDRLLIFAERTPMTEAELASLTSQSKN